MQALPSLIFIAVWNTPVVDTQPSVVQAFPSSVFTAVCVITPVEVLHASTVQALLSSIIKSV